MRSNPKEKEIREHDFSRGDLIERVSMQAIQRLLETFARSTTQKFTTTLHQPCGFELEKIDQIPWGDLAEEFESGMYFFTFSLKPLTGRGVLAIPTEEVLALVDLRLSGSGDDDFSGRIPSEIDQAFLVPIMQDVISELSSALARIQTTEPQLETQEGNILFVSVASAPDMCMVARLSFYVANRAPREVLICLPFQMVRTFVENLQYKTSLVGDGPKGSFSAETRQRLMEVPLDVTFQFPSITAYPSELLNLRVGDSLGLGHPRGRPLEVRAEGILVALADICSSGVHKALEIVEEVTK